MLITSLYYVALCCYHEARGESLEGQVLVAQSIFNRAEQRKISVKSVVYQPHQYSWTADDYPDLVKDHTSFINCLKAVAICLERRLLGDTENGINLYHAARVHPNWADSPKVTFLKQVGKHKFYYEERN